MGQAKGENVYTGRMPFNMRLHIKDSFFIECLFLTLSGSQEVKMYILDGCHLICVFTSRIAFSLNVVPWYTTVSETIVSVSDISAVNFTVGC